MLIRAPSYLADAGKARPDPDPMQAENADSAGLTQFPIRPATFARSAARACAVAGAGRIYIYISKRGLAHARPNYHCKHVRVISTLAGLPQLHLFGGFYSVHVRVILTLPGYSQLQMFLQWLN